MQQAPAPKPRVACVAVSTALALLLFSVPFALEFGVQGKDDRAKVTATRMSIKGVENAVELYKLDCGAYPTLLGDLQIQPMATPKWAGPYLKEAKAPRDAWDNALLYRRRKSGEPPFDVCSLGRDGAPGGRGFDEDIHGSVDENDDRGAGNQAVHRQ